MTSERLVRSVFAAFTTLAALAGGCADLSRGPAPAGVDAGAGDGDGDGGSPESDATVSFAAVHSLLTGSCMRCHAAGGEAGDTSFLLTGEATADLAAVTRFIDPSAPGGSRLLAKMSGNGHGGGTVFAAGSVEYETVLRWIQEGARP